MGKITASDLWKQIGLEGNPDSLNREYIKSLQFRNGGKDFLKNLHKRGIAVSIVTNDLPEWSIEIRNLYGLQGINPWIISSENGVRKPDPAILEILKRSSGIAYQSCLVLDTEINFLDTAQSLGMKTVLLDDGSKKADPNLSHPKVSRLNEFFKRQ
jgi:HAD superfamily hydrolase (TIGR01509 family)